MTLSKSRIRDLLTTLGEQFTIEELISKLNVSPTTAKKYIQIMIRDGYLERVDDTYRITERARSFIERDDVTNKKVEEKYSYIFTDQNGNPIPLRVDSILKLYIAVKYQLVPDIIVMEHIKRGYLSTWIRDHLNAHVLARRIMNVKSIEEFLGILEEYIEE